MEMSLQPTHRWRFFIVAVVISGAALRFVNLDLKPFWFNEVFTAIKISGYDEHREINPTLYGGHTHLRERLVEFQQLKPGSNVTDVVSGLIAKDVKWAPGYFAIARIWAEGLGTSVVAMRLLPVVISLAVLPALYWLCVELFRRTDVGWIAMALHAVSPIFLRYAQEARPTSLWALCIVLSSAALLRAFRQNTHGAWSLYAAGAALGLYVNGATAMVLAAYAAYAVSTRRERPTRALYAYAAATSAALLAFAPWLTLMVHNRGNVLATTNHLRQSPELAELLQIWGIHLSRGFVAWGDGVDPLLAWTAIAILILVACALRDLWCRGPRHVPMFVTILIAVPIAILVLPDLFLHWQVSSRDRYFLPAYLGVQLAIAHLVATRVAEQPLASRARAVAAAALLLAGTVSCLLMVRAETWWGLNAPEREAARLINSSLRPVVITQVDYGTIGPVARDAGPGVAFVLLGRQTPVAIPAGFSDVFVFRPSPSLRQALAGRGRLEPANERPRTDIGSNALYRLVGE